MAVFLLTIPPCAFLTVFGSKRAGFTVGFFVPTFDLQIYSGFQVATYPAGATFGPRALWDYEFVWIIEGDATYRRNETEVEAPQGSIVLCRPGVTDFFRWDTRRRTRHGWFHFHIAGDLPDDIAPADRWPLVHVPNNEQELIPSVFRQLIALGPNGPEAPVSSSARLLAAALLATFVSEGPSASTSGIENPAYPDPVNRAMAFIAARLEESPSDSLPLPEIAQVACVTPEHLCRLFRSATGHSPAETVRLLRLDRAAVLLARTNYTVGEIAVLCGFESPFHFARRFKAVFDQTPTELRRTIAAGQGTVPTTRLIRIAHPRSGTAV